MDANDYIAERLDDQVAWYDRKSLLNQKRYKTLRMTQFLAAALIPFMTTYLAPEQPTIKLLVGLLGVTVAVITATLDLFRFQEHWIGYRTTCESLKKEKYLFLTESEPYATDRTTNYRLLVQRSEALISRENSHWSHRLHQTTSELEGENRNG